MENNKEKTLREYIKVSLENDAILSEQMTPMQLWKMLPKKFMLKIASKSALSPVKWTKFAAKSFKEENLDSMSKFMGAKMKADGADISTMEKPEELAEYLNDKGDEFISWLEEWYNGKFKPDKPMKLK